MKTDKERELLLTNIFNLKDKGVEFFHNPYAQMVKEYEKTYIDKIKELEYELYKLKNEK